MINTLLFPSDVFNRKQIDADMEREYGAALETGFYETILFGYDDWFNRGQLRLSAMPEHPVDAVYRGWMMTPEQYQEFYNQLYANNVRLITTPEMYASLHIFPNVYPKLVPNTARILTYPLHSQIDINEVKKVFPRFMEKDFVKSVKGTEFPLFFDQTVTQAEFDRWMEVFYKYRANLLTGGICIKEFFDLKRYDGKANEFRVFYLNHQIGSISRNSLQGAFTPEPPLELIEKYRHLDSVFYTIDYAELADGTWTIVEAGDGSVSGLSDQQNYQAFYRALYYCMN